MSSFIGYYWIASTYTRNSFAVGTLIVGAVTMIRFAVEYTQSKTYGSHDDSFMNVAFSFRTEFRLWSILKEVATASPNVAE